MSDIAKQKKVIAKARRHRNEVERALQKDRQKLNVTRRALVNAQRLGAINTRIIVQLKKEIKRQQKVIKAGETALTLANTALEKAISELATMTGPIQEMDDSLPILLLPVRLETRFVPVDSGTELWVRFFPDDVAIHSHEIELTADEHQAGNDYWREIWSSQQLDDANLQQIRQKGSWRLLVNVVGATRAAWVRLETEPATLDVNTVDELVFPDVDEQSLKEESWSQAPRSKVMPDHFIVSVYVKNKKVAEVVGNKIPDPLITGPDPQLEDAELVQRAGELEPGANLEWIFDFDRALALGMAVRIHLDEPHASQGVDRLLAIGLRLPSDHDEGAALIEELIANHHYAPDGFGLVRQGTPTNNTSEQVAGFNSTDPLAERSQTTETGAPLFDLTSDASERTDAQRLVEALGIDHRLLQHVENAERKDVYEAQLMNKALWSATAGYYLEELIGLTEKTVGDVRQFFTQYVQGRSALPAIRVGTQPYGILLTSAFKRWRFSTDHPDGLSLTLLNNLQKVLQRFDQQWTALSKQVSHVHGNGDPFANLLESLGLHASSVEFYRRHATGRNYLWNYQQFKFSDDVAKEMQQNLENETEKLLNTLGLDFETSPKIAKFAFFRNHDEITDPLIDDVDAVENEVWSEENSLAAKYKTPDTGELQNYIGWLVNNEITDIKAQKFVNQDDERQPVPRPLMFRLLRRALLLTYHDETLKLYQKHKVVESKARREIELPNVQSDRAVTRWEFMEANISRVLPQVSNRGISVAEFLRTSSQEDGKAAPFLNEQIEALKELGKPDMATARLERLFAEHLDLCSYRLDAWQMGLFTRRLERLRQRDAATNEVPKGLYIGACGWLEDIRPAPPATPVTPDDLPESLRPDAAQSIVMQQDNAGFIAAPSVNHAVTAAVLRNAYLTHADTEHPERMAVDLSSARVRSALQFLEGIRNGQELGALLGYQFERGLQDRHNDPSLSQFVTAFRQRYPLVADKITPDEENEKIESKQARNVFDGYALIEHTILPEDPIGYPYQVTGLPADNPNNTQVKAIKAEVDRMADSFDAIADLALAEGVFQIAQGNFDRGGAMMQAMTRGNTPPEPDIAKTPRTGAAITHRVMINLDALGNALAWPEPTGPRAQLEPGLNQWLAQILGTPEDIRVTVSSNVNDAIAFVTVAELKIQPIDLIYMVSDDLDASTGAVGIADASELERRLLNAYERINTANGITNVGDVSLQFMQRDPNWPNHVKTLFEMLPLLRYLHDLVTGCRSLSARDLRLPTEASVDKNDNPQNYVIADVEARVTTVVNQLQLATNQLQQLQSGGQNTDELASALFALAAFGIPDAVPKPSAERLLQAEVVLKIAQGKLNLAARLLSHDGLPIDEIEKLSIEDQVANFALVARAGLGDAFTLLPRFTLTNKNEIGAAQEFRDSQQLTRHSANPLIVDEWLQGIGRVREKMASIEGVATFTETFATDTLDLLPLQLPFRVQDHWVAVEYPAVDANDIDNPDVFVPQGDYLSIVQHLASGVFDPAAQQQGMVVDEWTEVIPNKVETTGIAVHYNQPGSEPPQTLILAVSPEIKGHWTWENLEATLHETIDRAKTRGVEPEHLDTTPFAHILPAILTAVASYKHATISTDLVHQTESAFQDEGG